MFYRLLHDISPNMGGVEIVVQKISETLAANGARVTVYSVDFSYGMLKQQEISGVLVKRFTPLLGDPLYVPEPEFVTALRREKADILHVHNIRILPPFLVALFKHGEQKLLLQPHCHRFGQSPLRNSLLKLYKYTVNNVMMSRI